jgi:tetratricopeptide (TPR) repeat protein
MKRTLGALIWSIGLGLSWGIGGCAADHDTLKKADGYYREGLANIDTDRQQAFVSFQKSLQLNPKNKDTRYYLGHLYALQGKYPQAEGEFREAIRLDSDYAEAFTYLGQVLASQDRWQEAIRAYRHALGNPLYATPDLAWFHLGRALAHEGEMEKAVQAFEDALVISPPNVPPALCNLELGRAYYKMGYDQKAREALLRAVKLDKDGDLATEASRLLERLKP